MNNQMLNGAMLNEDMTYSVQVLNETASAVSSAPLPVPFAIIGTPILTASQVDHVIRLQWHY